jgi:hypothetical protein
MARTGAAPGARVGLAIRCENLRLGAAAAACRARLPARLEEIVYRGTTIDHRLRLADGQLLQATSTRRELAGDEGEVTVGCDPADLILLED